MLSSENGRVLLLFLVLLIFSCKKDTAPAPNPADGLIYAFEKSYITYVIHDPANHRLYGIQWEKDGSIISYDYEQQKIVGMESKKLSEEFFQYEAAAGVFAGKNELYLAQGKTIYIYSTDNLRKTDSIVVTNPEFIRIMAMDRLQDSMLFIGGCGSIEFPPQTLRTRAVNRRKKQVVSATHTGDNCMMIRTFKPDNQTGTQEYGVFILGGDGKFALERYDGAGNLIDVKSAEYHDQPTVDIMGVSDNSPYVILESNGQIFLKEDLSFVDSLSGQHIDYYLTPGGDKIYALAFNGQIDVYEYPSLTLTKVIKAPVDYGYHAFPQRLFYDGKRLIAVFSDLQNIYIYLTDM